MTLGPIGMNAGMDVNSIVSKVVDAERLPKQQRIDNQRTQNETSISAYGRLRESLDTMKNLMAGFRQDKAFALRKASSTDEEVVSAKAATDAIAGRYAVDVLQLAQSHKLASGVIPEDTKFGPGKLDISLGEKTFSVDIRNKSKLKDVVNQINHAKGNPGIRASVINDVNGPRLIIASNQSGKDNKVSISAEGTTDKALKRLEYKTLEQRVKDLEDARSQAQQLIHPLTPEQQKVAGKVAEKLENAARAVDESVAQEIKEAAKTAQDPSDTKQAGTDLSDSAVKAAATAGEAAQTYIKPEDRIPGWTETASGTLLDSYSEGEPPLSGSDLEKSGDVPGWSNTASGTLLDSYVTPKEAAAELKEKLAQEQQQIEQAIKSGEMTPEEAKELERSKLSPEEKAYVEKVENVQAQLKEAQNSFDAYQGMTEVQSAQDAEVILDGVAKLASHNNIIEDAIEGVDLTLKGESDPKQKTAEVDIEYDRNSVRENIEKFVSAYNQFYQTSQQLSVANPKTGEKGPLAGDSIVRSADSRLKRVFSSPVEQAPENLKTLTEFGITTTRQGTLEINHDMLNKQLNNNFDKLGDFFGGRKGFAKQVEDAIQSMTGVTGSIRSRENSLRDQNYRLDDEQDTLDRRMDALEKRTHNKFSAMKDATSKMQSQLAGMMNALGQG
ncbi:flagellar filament capping protein FliD [Vibrio quintilis]|uniref:Flagellar hook-associated protein 2 n=1 Tax=Vibrio quintilis TaxID=1117707 RepID=A0A1M7YTE2_9VIBR|nr:flagellar filament capping protein FliD [Vibrio quintilis]SHO55848.1 Flagellar hook-associated protein 2 [Vibrio quintilis]